MLIVYVTEFKQNDSPSVFDVEAFRDGDEIGLWQHETNEDIVKRIMAIADEFGTISEIIRNTEITNKS